MDCYNTELFANLFTDIWRVINDFILYIINWVPCRITDESCRSWQLSSNCHGETAAYFDQIIRVQNLCAHSSRSKSLGQDQLKDSNADSDNLLCWYLAGRWMRMALDFLNQILPRFTIHLHWPLLGRGWWRDTMTTRNGLGVQWKRVRYGCWTRNRLVLSTCLVVSLSLTSAPQGWQRTRPEQSHKQTSNGYLIMS